MAISRKKLFRRCWEAADKMRGGMDPSEYKNYIFPIMFMKAASIVFKDRDDVKFPEGTRFEDLLDLRGRIGAGESLTKALEKFQEANRDLQLGDVLRVDYNSEAKLGSQKEVIEKVSRLLTLFEDTELAAASTSEAADLFGDVYEFMMGKFAIDSGKSKGQFYTPPAVSVALARLSGVRMMERGGDSIYDPTCGSGSLLLRAREEAIHGFRQRGMTSTRYLPSLFGQENEGVTAGLARMNMLIHMESESDIKKGNTLSDPQHKEKENVLEQFNFIVSNPPFSLKDWSTGMNLDHDNYDRFVYGIPPEKNGDYAFLQHVVHCLKPGGRAAVIFPHGVLFRGGKEGIIRRNLIEAGLFKAVIGLPINIFYGTGIPACILVLRKPLPGEDTGGKPIFFIDASRHFREEDGKNVLREADIHRMVTAYENDEEQEGYSRMAERQEIEANNFNLNISRYVAVPSEGFAPDLQGHLFGGIPDRHLDRLSPFLDNLKGLRGSLLRPVREGYSCLIAPADALAETVNAHPSVMAFRQRAEEVAWDWWQAALDRFDAVETNTHLREMGAELAAGVRDAYADLPPMDAWATYQSVADRWRTMLEDAARIVSKEGWNPANTDLLSDETIRRFRLDAEDKRLTDLSLEREAVLAEIADLEEEAIEGGLLADAASENGGLTTASCKARLKQDDLNEGEGEAIRRWTSLGEKAKALARDLKTGETELRKAVTNARRKLTSEDVKELLLLHAWQENVLGGLHEVIESVLGGFVSDLMVLARDYGESLPDIFMHTDDLQAKVDGHLHRMGIVS